MGILAWIIISFIVAFLGKERKIGFGLSLVISLLLSPLIGIICVGFSKRKQTTAEQLQEAKAYFDTGALNSSQYNRMVREIMEGKKVDMNKVMNGEDDKKNYTIIDPLKH